MQEARVKAGSIIGYRGNLWRLGELTRTSDGFILANGTLLDSETLEAAKDEGGWPILHSFFLGAA